MPTPVLPREIIKWLQSLDLSYTVKNPKRDFSNGYIVAEILSRHYPRDVNLNSFENGTRLECKVNNWEQIYKLFKKKGIQIGKHEFDPVIHCAPDAAVSFIFHLYNVITGKQVRLQPQEQPEEVPPFMRDTAAKRLKDNEIARVQDNVERTIRAIDTLGYYHEERRAQKAIEAPLLMHHERQQKMSQQRTIFDTMSKDEVQESVQINEVRVNALAGSATQLRGKPQQGEQQPKSVKGGRAELLQAVSRPRTSVGALATMQQPALFVKPAADIMRPLVLSIIQEYEELAKMIDTRKDIVVSFMEQCREGVPEDISVKVFEILAQRAALLVDTLTKSPPEFWKVWSTLYPALADFSESSPVFESAAYLLKRLGHLMREADPTLTQQLITEVGMPSLSRELSRAPEKREQICEIVYAYTQEDTLNHLLVLRALKDKVRDLSVYVSCLACLVSYDASLSLLDEHLLDLYIYYALMAMQSPQPKVRVAGMSILSTIAMCSSQHNSIVALIPSFAELANDEWWEVQAQLLLLSAHLLRRVTLGGPSEGRGDGEEGSASGTEADDGRAQGDEDVVEQLLTIISRLLVVSNSKNVLQVGLSALVSLLCEYPTLLPMFVAVLLEQPAPLRQRLLRPQEPADPEKAGKPDRVAYVNGNSSRMYEEKCVSSEWPHLDVARTFAMQLEASPLDRFELEHAEVFRAALPDEFREEEADEWVDIFEKVKQYIVLGLVDPDIHQLSAYILQRFWLAPSEKIMTRSIETSKKTLLQALRILYGSVARTSVDEASVLRFLRELRAQGGIVGLEVASVVETFREALPAEYEASQLHTIFEEPMPQPAQEEPPAEEELPPEPQEEE